jgi:anti-sigma factor RsiW
MDYLEGQLPADERAVLEQHLAKCPPCVTYLETYRQAVQLGKSAFCGEPCEMPEELVRTILKSLGRRD